MRIAVVSAFYSEGMGYTENCLPKALAALGHDVHLITSNLNVYGNEESYRDTYESFLGPADQGTRSFVVDGYTVHRLPSRIAFGYVYICHLYRNIRDLAPDIVHSIEIASFQTFALAAMKPFLRFSLFTETHQHLSIIKPFLKRPQGNLRRVLFYKLTRTVPSYVASLGVEKCHAISPDCADVANRYYGVPRRKLVLRPLGTDTDLFRPPTSHLEMARRDQMRFNLGYGEHDIVCIYTGKLAEDKNPLLLAQAVRELCSSEIRFCGLFIGDGIQKDRIISCPNVRVLPFMKYKDLADYYRLADIAVWPTQESMSMLDAASSGLPLIVSDRMGEGERVNGNGRVYREGSVEDLGAVLLSFASQETRRKYGNNGRSKMVRNYSWMKIAGDVEREFVGGEVNM